MSIKTIPNFIAGEFVSSGNTFEKRSPVNNEVIATVAEASREDVDQAVTSARTALRGSWAKISTSDRSDMLYAIANEMTRRFDDVVDAQTADTGMPAS
ncbi:MAG: aldehyde dehydrogenase family protein, partial [Rugosibacter sp.]|nr:aldehyde dehydrogenase family protein [Rugosibacter sp.]